MTVLAGVFATMFFAALIHSHHWLAAICFVGFAVSRGWELWCEARREGERENTNADR